MAGAVLALLSTVLGVHPTSTAELERALARGGVESVVVHGDAPPPDIGQEATGWDRSEVRWRDGLLRRSAEVTSVLPATPVGERSAARAGADGRLVVGDVAAHLRELAPGLEVERRPAITTWWALWGITVPGWLVLAAAATWLTALGVLLHGPRPWLLSRWGWAWVVLLLPWGLGVAAMCLLAGPTPHVPRGRGLRRRWGGLRGLLLVLVSNAVLPGR
ncbi:hypothetical protein WDV85_10845 [Pseudokineococcus sp. 5B2Z-1]|uniref:hypothetical protein n=1 Tax=Pseudokineococcus sp. 5B2Z-1 TaxID=3132744 RepID=UPI0030A32C51